MEIRNWKLIFEFMNIVPSTYALDLIPCTDGSYADPSIGCVTSPASVVNPESSLAELILKIASLSMVFVAGVCMVILIFGGITYAMAMGNEDKLQKSKRMIIWSLIGLVVALLARVLTGYFLNLITS